MKATLTDYTMNFHIVSRQKELSPGTRSLFTALVGEFNAAYFPNSLQFSDRVLSTLAGLKSVSSVFECRNVLKMHGFIDFKTQKGKRTTYVLKEDWFPKGDRTVAEQKEPLNRTDAEHLPNTRRAVGAVSCWRSISKSTYMKFWKNENEICSTDSQRTREREFDSAHVY